MSNTVGEMPGIVVLFSCNSMGDIIYIGYDVINTLDVMSYQYRCDVIKCSCDVTHTECDVIHIECNVIDSGCNTIDTLGLMPQIQWM